MDNSTTIAIGGLGGSGTRLIAHLLKEHNFNIGSTLNVALDNLFFTLIFRRPSWFKTVPNDIEIEKAIRVFLNNANLTTGQFKSDTEKRYVLDLITNQDTTIYTQAEWLDRVDKHLVNNTLLETKRPNLAWKEPNTHVFLPQLAKAVNDFKYIHVLRDGLYMAQSRNQHQLKMWATALGVNNTEMQSPSANAFNYWLKANSRALQIGQTVMQGNLYIADYDKLCANPIVELSKILEFLGVQPDEIVIGEISQTIKPKSIDEGTKNAITQSLSSTQMEQYYKLVEALDSYNQ